MKRKRSLHILLAILLIFSLFPVIPPRTSAAPVTLNPIQSKNTILGERGVTDYHYINALDNTVSVAKFGGIDPSRPIESAFITIDGFEDYFDIADLNISIAEDQWPTTAPGHQYPNPHPMPALLSPEQSIHFPSPNLFSQGAGTEPGSLLYRFDVEHLLTPTREDGVVSFQISSTSVNDYYIFNIKLEIEYVPNTAPVLNAIGNKSVHEGSQLSFTASATDAEGNPLTYSLVGAPTGASINATSGAFTWTPTEAQGPGDYTVTVRVSDGDLTDEESITVSVAEVNTPPILNSIGNRSIDEESLLTFTALATDTDIPANTLTYGLVGAPTGATINASSGEFSWTPTEAQGPGSYTFTVRVSDGTATDQESITVTVNEVNAPPILNPIGDRDANEGSLLTFTATATDSDSATLTYSLVDEPAGAIIHPSTGVFTWTPTEMQGPGLYTFKVVVSDGTASAEEEISITVNEVNTAPILNPIGDHSVDEGTILTFTALATDSDYPANTLSYSLVGAPTGASIGASTGIFTWTPTEEQGPGSFTFQVVVTDAGSASDEEEITVTVHEVNTAPVLDAITDKTVAEETELTFIAIATDSDLPANTLTFSLIGPVGATIDEVTGEFSWIPTEAQGPGTYPLKILVSDGVLTDEQDFIVTVNEVNAAPVLDAIGDQVVNEESLLTFTATANDSDSTTLSFSLVNAPTGASINEQTGEFSWTPTEAQGPASYTFKVMVSDGSLSDEEEITVTVNEVNIAPVLAVIDDKTVNEGSLLNFTVTATDVDLPANSLSFSLVHAPAGATINASTGEFSWTPTEAQGPSDHTLTVVVSDGTLTDEQEITVTVHEINVAPVLATIGDKMVNEGVELSFTVTATDIDLPVNTLSFSLVNAPTGATIDATTGEFSWTPSESQGPDDHTFTIIVSDGALTDEEEITVTVNEVNSAPVLAAIGNKNVNEGSTLTFTVSAIDADLPANTLTYHLINAPAGASIDSTTGEFNWTPTELQGPNSYTLTIAVSDGMLSDEEEITITVYEVNTAPVLATIGNHIVNEGNLLSFTATATDADLPANLLSFSLLDAPIGATINPTTGEFSWTPSEAQGPGSYTFTVVVGDGGLSDEEEITVTVHEVNTAPVLAAIGSKTVNEGNELSFTASATDADLPANTLSFSLSGAPTGATIDASNGEFSWTPTEAEGPGEYIFTIVVSDGALSDEEEITVTVNEINTAPVLAAIGDKSVNEGVELSFTAVATDADLPANSLSYSLVDAPTGATIEASSGGFSWTPSEAQGPGEFTFTVVVSDGALTDEEEITVTVNEVNTAPVIAAIGNQSIAEETELSFVVSVTDSDLPSNSLTFSLLDAPEGASIHATTGEFSWTPTEAQGPNNYTFKVQVSDGELTNEEEITVTVGEVNIAPVLAAIGNKGMTIGNLLKFSVSATDIDLPANTLVYSLVDGPAGAVIDSETGEFSWRPGLTGKHTFTIQVSDGSLTAEEELTVTVSSVPIPEPAEEVVEVLINGKVENAGKITTGERNGQKVVTLVVNEQLITKRLEEEGKHAVITIPVNVDGNVVIAELNGQLLKMMQSLQSTIVLKTKHASYTLPIEQINFAAISKKFGDDVALEDLKISIEVSESTSRGAQLVTEALKRIGVTQLVPPLQFKVNVEYKGQTIEVSQFNAYVKRSITIPANVDPKQITTGVVVEEDGTIRHVPTQMIESENSSEAVINSLTNSTYTLIWNPVQFTDVENHWAKDAINNMGSRLVVSGVGNGMYNPDQHITRAEFAAIIVRGLGLRLVDEESAFTDVSSSSWYHQAVQTAHQMGLINGFEDGTFRPNDKITREQAMLILSKAMVITALLESEGNHASASIESLQSFVDADSISAWALHGVAESVHAEIFSGRSKDTIAPKAFITRAEVATIVQRLLQKSNLID